MQNGRKATVEREQAEMELVELEEYEGQTSTGPAVQLLKLLL